MATPLASATEAATSTTTQSPAARLQQQLFEHLQSAQNVVCGMTNTPIDFIINDAKTRCMDESFLSGFRSHLEKSSFQDKVGYMNLVILDANTVGRMASVTVKPDTTPESLLHAFNHDMMIGFDSEVSKFFSQAQITLKGLKYTAEEKTLSVEVQEVSTLKTLDPNTFKMSKVLLAPVGQLQARTIQLTDAMGNPRFIDSDGALLVQALICELRPSTDKSFLDTLPVKYSSPLTYGQNRLSAASFG